MEERRRNIDYVTKHEFCAFKDRMETALFAPDEQNDFGQPGLTVMMRDLYHTGKTFCRIARWIKWALPFVIISLTTGKAMGWW